MSRLQAIENALSSINPAAFQEMCDSFLALRNSNYSTFSRTGSQSGKQKTIKGTPDTFLLLPNGKFIFVEYSTNITAGLSKLQDDIEKCINEKKTGIQLNQISEIIFCINYNLKTDEIVTLKNLLKGKRILLTVYTLDALAIELHINHRDLSHHYLGLPLDTGQIVSIKKFITEYNRASRGISTPLDNVFQHRDDELNELKESISNFDFIILTGAPGVGKTKLALEGMKSFLSENLSFSAYCVSYKNHTLLDDLFQYFDTDKDYLLFVDDANRIDAFNQITGFYKSSRKGKLKIIITVRDYAFQEIGILCQEFSPKRIDLMKFSDKQIIDIIEEEQFKILNPDYQKEIVRIAEGNPRLAIMTALLAKAEQNINALSDVSDLFEKYFATFIKDDGEFANEFNIKCLGIIAFFYTIPYKNKEITSSILQNFGLDYSCFIDAVDKLDKLELLEIQFEYVKIPEQNLSTYFFYRAFIKDNLLSFEILLNKYFNDNSKRFTDCVVPANNTFGHINVMDVLQPILRKHWKEIKNNEENAFKLLNIFWFYLQSETLEFIFNIVESSELIAISKYEVTYENNAFSYNKNEVIELLGNFFTFPIKLKDVIELSFEYTRRKPEHLSELIHKIKEQLTFDRDDEQYGFDRQLILYEILIEGLNKGDLLYSACFYELSKTFLSFKFQHAKGGRNHSFYLYDYSLPNTLLIHQFREKIWKSVHVNFNSHPDDSFNLLESYSKVNPDVIKDLMNYDVPFLVDIIKSYLSSDSFEHCKYVQDQVRWCKRKHLTNQEFDLLKKKFTNPVYEAFMKIDWNRLRDKEQYEFDDYKEYEKLKEEEIRTSFVFKNLEEVKWFYDTFYYLKKLSNNDWSYGTTLDFVIDENCTKNFELGCNVLKMVIENDNEVNYIPRVVFRNHLKSESNSQAIWAIIQKDTFKNKSLWELFFYDYINESLLDVKYVNSLINTIANMVEPHTIHFDRLQRFLEIEPNLFQIILKKIVEKNETEGANLKVWMDFFSIHFDQLGDDIELVKKAYLQQEKINSHFDYQGNGLLNILKKDSFFLIDYVKSLYAENHSDIKDEHKDLGFVWQIENIETVLSDVFDLLIEEILYFGISEHFLNSFFRNLEEKIQEKAKKFLLNYCEANFENYKKINVLIDIVRHTMRGFFDEILLFYLTLNQDKENFSKISWRGNHTTAMGDVILSDIEMADWMNIQAIVEKSDVGFKLIPIKKYLIEQIEYCKKSGDKERQRRFLERI